MIPSYEKFWTRAEKGSRLSLPLVSSCLGSHDVFVVCAAIPSSGIWYTLLGQVHLTLKSTCDSSCNNVWSLRLFDRSPVMHSVKFVTK